MFKINFRPGKADKIFVRVANINQSGNIIHIWKQGFLISV